HALAIRARFERAAARLRAERTRVVDALAGARDDGARRAATARRRARHALETAVAAIAAEREAEVRERLAAEIAPLRQFFTDLTARQQEFTTWLPAAREEAG